MIGIWGVRVGFLLILLPIIYDILGKGFDDLSVWRVAPAGMGVILFGAGLMWLSKWCDKELGGR